MCGKIAVKSEHFFFVAFRHQSKCLALRVAMPMLYFRPLQNRMLSRKLKKSWQIIRYNKSIVQRMHAPLGRNTEY